MVHDEFSLIERLTGRIGVPSNGVRIGVGDDAAVLMQEADLDLLITTDTLVEGVHFTDRTMDFPSLGYKAVAVSISDIAAMGGQPTSVVMALTVPKRIGVEQLEALYEGIGEICAEYSCPLVGGNMTRTEGPLVITSTVTGTVPAGTAVLRSGAKPGDVVFVTGGVGGSAAGLHLMLESITVAPDDHVTLAALHRRPQPQVTAGVVLREAGATSLNDVSDGLASELNEIAAASGVRLRIEADRVPIAPAVRNFARIRGVNPLELAWYGGEDYQLVGTAPNFQFARALAQCEMLGVSLTAIGRVEMGDGVVAVLPSGQLELLEARGFNHFRES